jgi:hypothetical protein
MLLKRHQMIADQEQLNIALHQLGSFKGMLEAMSLHLQKTEPTLIPLVSESYRHRIQELQEEICDYLLLQQSPATIEPAEFAPSPRP